MSTETTKSQIKEVLDQVSLDYADGKYLNIVSSNLGLNRPLFGFSDDTWRAITKIIALQFKQITNKFKQVLELLIGPKKTRLANVATDLSVGTKSFTVIDSSDLPEVGTLILDEGLVSEETLDYCFIDRNSNTIFLKTNTSKEHTGVSQDAEALLLVGNAGDTEVLVSDAQRFPSSGYPYTLVLGRGTDSEEVVSLTGVDVATKTLTTSALSTTHLAPVPKLVSTTLSFSYAPGSFFLIVNDVSAFPDEGILILEDSAASFTATGGSATTVSVAASTFVRTNSLSGYKIAFDGNVTSALEDVEVFIKSNTDSSITFFTALASSPAAGDTFTIRPVVEFSGKDLEENTLNLKVCIPFEVAPGVGTQIECLSETNTASLAGLQVKAAEWEIFDNGAGLLEIFVPDTELERLRLLDASYLHPEEDSGAPSTNVRIATVVTDEPSRLFVDSTIGFPEAGVLALPSENVGFTASSPTFLVNELAVGATSMVVTNSSVLPGPGGEVDINVDGVGETVTVITNDTLTNTVTFAAISLAHPKRAIVREAAFEIPHGFNIVASISDAVTLYEPLYAGTNLFDGGGVTTTDTFEGPYVYDDTQVSNTLTGNTTLAQTVAGPTRLAITLSPETGTKSAVEVEDANKFPLTSTFQMKVDDETMTATEVSLKQRCFSSFDGNHGIGSSTIATTAGTLRPGLYTASDFPLASGYRIILNKGGGSEEVVFVQSLSGDTITLDSPTTTFHSSGEPIELYSDTITVQQIDKAHTGVNAYSDRSVSGVGVLKPRPSTINSDSLVARVTPLYSSITVTDATNYSPTGGSLILSAGVEEQVIETELFTTLPGAFVLSCQLPTDDFPTIYPYFLTVDPGHFVEEIVEVTLNDTALDRFTIVGGGAAPGEIQYTHNSGAKVRLLTGLKEVFSYDSVAGNVISFSSPIVVQSTHQAGEKVSISAGISTPSESGTDFPLRMPPDLLSRIKLLFDLIRAAGVEVRFINKR